MMYLLMNTKEEGTPPEVIAISKSEEEMRKITNALGKANATYSGGLYVVTYDGE